MDSSTVKWYKKVWFWVKIGLLVILAISLTLIGITAWDKLMSFFGFKNEEDNQVIIEKMTKVKTNQNKTSTTGTFIEEMKEKYLK